MAWWTNMAGLASGLAGSILVFFFGISQILDSEGRAFLVDDPVHPEALAAYRRARVLSRMGIIGVVLSFFLQAAAQMLPA